MVFFLDLNKLIIKFTWEEIFLKKAKIARKNLKKERGEGAACLRLSPARRLARNPGGGPHAGGGPGDLGRPQPDPGAHDTESARKVQKGWLC